MNLRQLEERVIGIVDRALAGQPTEDALVELKSQWLGPLVLKPVPNGTPQTGLPLWLSSPYARAGRPHGT